MHVLRFFLPLESPLSRKTIGLQDLSWDKFCESQPVGVLVGHLSSPIGENLQGCRCISVHQLRRL